MTGTITYILSRAGYRAMNGPLADERRRLAGAEPPAAYVSYDPRLLAGAGWYGYRIALKGGDRQMTELARHMLSERYTIRDGYEYYADGVYVFGVLLRERVPHYGIGGGAPTPEPEALNFYMPNGGTISLNKQGSPTIVELEYWLDENAQWMIWQPDSNGNRSLTLPAGQKVYIRNTSETSTGFSTSGSDYYLFAFTDDCYADGQTDSLLCKNYENASITEYCYRNLFYHSSLVTAPKLNSSIVKDFSYSRMFHSTKLQKGAEFGGTYTYLYGASHFQSMYENCVYLTDSNVLKMGYPGASGMKWMFNGCSSLNKIVLQNLYNISSDRVLFNWVSNVAATGDFYCPAELTIPTGASGIPTGWTRHDI